MTRFEKCIIFKSTDYLLKLLNTIIRQGGLFERALNPKLIKAKKTQKSASILKEELQKMTRFSDFSDKS